MNDTRHIPVVPRSYTGDDDFDEILEKCLEILSVKGTDYSLGQVDRLHNFRTVAQFTGQTPEVVLGIYFYKHISAIFSYIKSNSQNESEPIEGRIADAINYLILFYKMVQERKRTAPPHPTSVDPLKSDDYVAPK